MSLRNYFDGFNITGKHFVLTGSHLSDGELAISLLANGSPGEDPDSFPPNGPLDDALVPNYIGGPDPAQRVDFINNTFAAITIQSPNNHVIGNHFSGNAGGIGILGPQGNSNQVRNNYFRDTQIDAIRVFPDNPSPTGNTISENSIDDSEGLGINLGSDGVTPNDPGDRERDGPNEGQNFPVLSSAGTVAPGNGSSHPDGANGVTVGDGFTVISGALDSTADSYFRVEAFASPACSASGHGEGATFLGASDVRTDDSGMAAFTIELPLSVPIGSFITTTATDSIGNTSEFSGCQLVSEAPPTPNITVDFTPPGVFVPADSIFILSDDPGEPGIEVFLIGSGTEADPETIFANGFE